MNLSRRHGGSILAQRLIIPQRLYFSRRLVIALVPIARPASVLKAWLELSQDSVLHVLDDGLQGKLSVRVSLSNKRLDW